LNPNSSSETSLTLLQLCREDDKSAWETLDKLYRPLVERWCRNRGVSPDDAEDLAQVVFLGVATHLKEFRRDQPGQRFRKWLKTIALNFAKNHLRNLSGKPRAAGGTDHQVSLDQVEDDGPTDSDEDQQELRELLHLALRIIQPDFQPNTWTAFLRTEIEGEKVTDVAKSLGMKPNAVRQSRYRVREKLKAVFAGLIDFDEP